MADRVDIARELYRAYETGERELAARHLAPDFEFYAPPDPGIDLAAYWERCWPNAGLIESFDFVRLEEIEGDAVLATYESTKTDGSRFRNTEILTFRGDEVIRAEVYFGWDL